MAEPFHPPNQPKANEGIPKTSETCLYTLKEHSDAVYSIAISPDGEKLVSGSNDTTIRVWHLQTGELERTLLGHSHTVHSLAISPDGQMLASCSENPKSEILLWDLPSGRLVKTISQGKNETSDLLFTRDGKTLIVASTAGEIDFCKPHNGECLNYVEEYEGASHLAISPDGETLVGASVNSLTIRGLHPFQLLRELENPDFVYCVGISPNGQTFAGGDEAGTIRIWHRQSGELLLTLDGGSKVWSLAFSPDGNSLVSGCKDKTIKVWNLHTGKLENTLKGHSAMVMCVAISPDGQKIVSGSIDNTIKVWGLA